MINHLIAIFSGAAFVLSIIASIGPQNLNIISHAIKKNHALAVATTCVLADLVLLLAGGIGLRLSGSKLVIVMINIAGIIFMLWYLIGKIKNLFRHRDKLIIQEETQTRKQAVLRALALTWLNPLVLIDTIVIIGGTSSQYHGTDWTNFMLGAILGDIAWIYGITLIARSFAKQLNRVGVWITLDITTIIIMLVILYKTIVFVI
jgi:L-lysine exporter family protein LysE/ArgO